MGVEKKGRQGSISCLVPLVKVLPQAGDSLSGLFSLADRPSLSNQRECEG